MLILLQQWLLQIILVKITLDHFRNEGKHAQSYNKKKPCFKYFCRFVTRALTLTPRNKYIYVFRAFFVLSISQATCYCFYKLRVKLFRCRLNFEQNEPGFLASQCTSQVMRRKPVQQNYLHFFKDLKSKSTFCMLVKLRLLMKMLLMEIILGPKVATNKSATKKPSFQYFCRFVTCALTLRPRNTYITIFQHYLDSSGLRPAAVFLEVKSRVIPF